MKGYKMLNSDMTANYGDMQYELRRTYKLEGKIIPCFRGYHFCKELTDCLGYYQNKDNDKRFFEVETGDDVIELSNKCVTNEITLIRELITDEVFDYIRENKDIVNWATISNWQKLSEEFIREFKDKVDWCNISMSQRLSEDFIREFENCVDWYCIGKHQKLSEEFIKEFQDRLDWFYICKYQYLTEEFIREFEDMVDWYCISKYQRLSEEFIREFQDKIDWSIISDVYQTLSEKFQ